MKDSSGRNVLRAASTGLSSVRRQRSWPQGVGWGTGTSAPNPSQASLCRPRSLMGQTGGREQLTVSPNTVNIPAYDLGTYNSIFLGETERERNRDREREQHRERGRERHKNQTGSESQRQRQKETKRKAEAEAKGKEAKGRVCPVAPLSSRPGKDGDVGLSSAPPTPTDLEPPVPSVM